MSESRAVVTSRGGYHFRFDHERMRLLKKHQALFLDPSEHLVINVRGTLTGNTRNLVSCHLSPTAFRLLAVLLFSAPEVTPYHLLFAGLYCPETCIESILRTGSLLVAEFQSLAADWRKQLGSLSETDIKHRLRPIRDALQRLNRTLKDRQFEWEVSNKYRQGYLLLSLS